MNHLDLFSGIGGFALAARWVWGEEHNPMLFCEIEEFPRQVLKKHWPDVPIYHDIKTLDATRYAGTIDLLTGGFPCQDISVSGRGGGLDGERSGLWSEMCRIIRDVRPRFVLVENSPMLVRRGLGRVLGDLAKIGYDAEWKCLPAALFGAPHVRQRIWILAYPHGFRRFQDSILSKVDLSQRRGTWAPMPIRGFVGIKRIADRGIPDDVRMGDGIPGTLDRIHALGNAIVPQVAAEIFRGIKSVEEEE